jgi:hypothetical protein
MGFDHEDPDARWKRGRSLPTETSNRTGFHPKLAATFSVTPLIRSKGYKFKRDEKPFGYRFTVLTSLVGPVVIIYLMLTR